MADWTAAQGYTTADAQPTAATEDGHDAASSASFGAKVYYAMLGRDDGAASPGYVAWVATSYDSAGAGFTGGTPAPVGNFVPGSAFAVAVYSEG